jgi:hypothetical protein
MTSKKNGNRRIGAGLRGRAFSSAESEDISGPPAVDVGEVIRGACQNFVLAADWQQPSNVASHREDGGLEDPVAGYRLTENHEGLHSGMYINVTLLRAANALAIKGGCFDRYRQPQTLHRESVPLREVTAESLGCLLMEMHDRLRRGDRAQVT